MIKPLLIALAALSAFGVQAAKPGHVAYYSWNNNAWLLTSEKDNTYDSETGLLLKIQSENAKVEYTYNADGLVSSITTSIFSGDGWFTSSKTEHSYDPIVTNLLVKTAETYYSETGNPDTKTTELVITRNSDGNITKVESTDPWLSVPRYSMEVEYGADKKANKISMTEYGELEYVLEDIVWENTNGQIVYVGKTNGVILNPENRIKSGKFSKLDHFTEPVYLEASYPDNKGSFKSEMKYKGELINSIDYQVLDAFGSYNSKVFDIDFDYDEQTGTIYNDGEMTTVKKCSYDQWGHLLNYTEQDYNEENVLDYEYLREGTVTLGADGNPEEYILKVKYDGAEDWTNIERHVYSNYVEVASVESVAADANAPVEYYNLQGVKIANPGHGIFIRRQGANATKVIF